MTTVLKEWAVQRYREPGKDSWNEPVSVFRKTFKDLIGRDATAMLVLSCLPVLEEAAMTKQAIKWAVRECRHDTVRVDDMIRKVLAMGIGVLSTGTTNQIPRYYWPTSGDAWARMVVDRRFVKWSEL